ncbi:MAG: DUF4921 family protein [Planctomycetes bacterium]|nr:DUF4921 family protein [Planctomycetota bacterium]
MNEMRYDWLSDRWVIFAPNRLMRPDDYDRSPRCDYDSSNHCPFCSGSEDETPEATLVLPTTDADATTSNRAVDLHRIQKKPWLVRVVPNKFPAVSVSVPFEEAPSGDSRTPDLQNQEQQGKPRELFQRRQTQGAHEVIIESPDHISSITGLTPQHAALVFEAYRKRLNHWRAHSNMRYAVVFKNYGADAGASLIHSHSQLICTDFVPNDIQRIESRMAQYHRSHQRCYVCDVLEQELRFGQRVVCESEHFVAICPFASRFPYSVSILPRRHRSMYETCSDDEIQDLSRMTQLVLRALESENPRAAYNYVIQSCSFESQSAESFHWRLKIIPRMCKVAGFEWGSDCFINTVTPEDAATSLRKRCVPITNNPVPAGSAPSSHPHGPMEGLPASHAAVQTDPSGTPLRICSGNPTAIPHPAVTPRLETSPRTTPDSPVIRLQSIE